MKRVGRGRGRGRDNGIVKTNKTSSSPWNPKPNSKFINSSFHSSPSARPFTKVPAATYSSHSNLTGKRSGSGWTQTHVLPRCKPKEYKTKGCQKLSLDSPRLNFTGLSATGILDRLATDHFDDGDDEEDYADIMGSFGYYDGEEIEEIDWDDDNKIYGDNNDGYHHDHEDDDDDHMSYCDVGLVLGRTAEDEGRRLVAEM